MVQEFFLGLLQTYGYLGIFAASLISSASVVLPVPFFIIIPIAVQFLDPLLVGIAAGIGAAIGELTSYLVGVGGNRVASWKKKKGIGKLIEKAEEWYETHGGFFVTFIFAVLPLPFDFVGILCGMMKYDVKKYFIATLLGKLLKYVFLAYAAFYGINFILSAF